ncbi:MAG: DNA repair protein RecO [Candidatus Moranbacteria bacterium]|nr:DNA repair protein RecO [Candidatus Moranbacteria bacterium]
MEYKYTGIVLSKKDIGETDRIYTIYTREAGKIKALGKSVRNPKSKLAGNLEPLTQVEFFVARTRGLGKITGVIAINNYPHIKNNTELLEAVSETFSILTSITSEQQKDETVFNLLGEFLEVLENLPDRKSLEKIAIIKIGFLFKLLAELGYQTEADKCSACGKKLQPEKNYFSIENGGVVCSNCGKNGMLLILPISIKLLRIFPKNSLKNLGKIKVNPENIQELETILQNLFQWIRK